MNHNEIAQVWMRECDSHLDESDAMLTELEERLANTPVPTEGGWNWEF